VEKSKPGSFWNHVNARKNRMYCPIWQTIVSKQYAVLHSWADYEYSWSRVVVFYGVVWFGTGGLQSDDFVTSTAADTSRFLCFFGLLFDVRREEEKRREKRRMTEKKERKRKKRAQVCSVIGLWPFALRLKPDLICHGNLSETNFY